MGLESRGGRFYYYRKVWDRGRVKSEYVGGGLLALLAARMEQEDREEKEARKASEQARWDERRERIDAVDSQDRRPCRGPGKGRYRVSGSGWFPTAKKPLCRVGKAPRLRESRGGTHESGEDTDC